MMENELLSPSEMLEMMEAQAIRNNSVNALDTFLASVNDVPMAMGQAYMGNTDTVSAITHTLNAYNMQDVVATQSYDSLVNETIGREYPVEVDADIEIEDDEDDELEESYPLTDAELGLVPTIATRPLTDEEVDYLATQSIVATGVGVDEDSEMNELLEAALDEMDASPVTPNIVVYDNLPVNSATLVINEVTSRFSSASWADKIKTKKVLLAGIGGIGSYVAYLLSRVDVDKLFLFDDDDVEAANLSGQMFGVSNIGQSKVGAMCNILANFSNYYKTNAQCRRYTENSGSMDIMICGFDNMLARKAFFNSWKRRVEGYSTMEEKSNCLYIDGRLAAEEYQVFCIKGDDAYNIARYERDFLFTDAEAEATVCSYKQTSFMANQIASTMVNLFVNYVANQCEPLFDRDLPFYTTYDGVTMFFKTEV